MANTQLACPHCGSTLNFEREIAPGSTVECLICMQSFAVQPKKAPEPAPEPAPAAKPAPAPSAIAVALKAKPAAPPPLPRMAKAQPHAEPVGTNTSGKLALLAVGAMLFVLLTIGAGFGIWFIADRNQANSDNGPIANADKGIPPAKENDDKPPVGDGKTNNPKKEDPAGFSLDDDEELRRKKEAEKIQLARKILVKPVGSDLEFDPISTTNLPPVINVPGLDQKKINTAIEKGVAYLKRSQMPNGSWSGSHELGHAAIGGLTLLECGVPAKDPAIQRSAALVRSQAATNSQTYELSLAVLFLDRLGEPRDRAMIQGLALRLLAGQNESGGWTYNVPLLPPQEMYQLYAFLQSHRAGHLENPVSKDDLNPKDPITLTAKDPYKAFADLVRMKGIDDGASPVIPKDDKKEPAKPAPKGKTFQPINPMWLNPSVRELPVIQGQGKKKGKQAMRIGLGDNSNTQFALLALWAARRHGVPTDVALLLGYQRFQVSQSPDGGWGYNHHVGDSTNTMTCVGLLGEAMGHGAATEVVGFADKNPKSAIFKPVSEDPAIQKGLKHLSTYLGQPSKDAKLVNYPPQNLYFLWSVERVAMLYDLQKINGKDWYGWGAQILVHGQQGDGEFPSAHYHGANGPLNTCFALLFLRRSNLVQDLTNHLRLHSVIRDSEK